MITTEENPMNTTPLLADTWNVRDVLPADGLARLSGKPGSGKSLTAFDLAAHVASGRNWHGQEVTQGRVLYVNADGPEGLKPRLLAWKKHHGVDAIGDLLFYPQSVAVGGPSWGMFVGACQRLDLDLIVLDGPFWTWMCDGAAETRDLLAETLAGMVELGRLTDAAVLVTHDDDDVSGATLAVSGSGDVVTVRVTGRRDAAPFRFKVTAVPVGAGGDGLPSSSVVLA